MPDGNETTDVLPRAGMDASNEAGQDEPPASQARSRSGGGIGPGEELSGVTEQGGWPRAGVLRFCGGTWWARRPD